MDDLEPLTIRFGARRVDLQRALEIVDDRQQILHEVDGGELRRVFALAIDALAIVIELRGLAQQPILEAVPFLAQLDDFVRQRRRGIGRRDGAPPSSSMRSTSGASVGLERVDLSAMVRTRDYMLSRRTRDTA